MGLTNEKVNSYRSEVVDEFRSGLWERKEGRRLKKFDLKLSKLSC